MSFHFQPQADSSDEEAAVDISAWKSGGSRPAQASAPSPPEAALQIMDELAGQLGEEADGEEIGTFQGDLNGAGQQAANEEESEEEVEEVPFVSSGFTSISKPARATATIALPDSSEDEEPTPTQVKLPSRAKRGAAKSVTAHKDSRARVLVPVIPRVELDSSEADEIIDFTAGNDVVRRVKKEIKKRRGVVVYQVEFEDRHVEEVSCYLSLSRS